MQGERLQTADGTTVLMQFNAASPDEAAATILPCNGSQAWASAMAAARPFADPDSLLHTSDAVWHSLPPDAWQQAFDSHPRIGERKAAAASAQSLTWSKGEQAAAQRNRSLQTALADGNQAYEAKFGRIFLICATGRSAAEILAEMQRRMHNDGATEQREAAEQQRQITRLRLRKWLGLEAA